MGAVLSVTSRNIITASMLDKPVPLPHFCGFRLLGTVTNVGSERLWEELGTGGGNAVLAVPMAVISLFESIDKVPVVVTMESSFTTVAFSVTSRDGCGHIDAGGMVGKLVEAAKTF